MMVDSKPLASDAETSRTTQPEPTRQSYSAPRLEVIGAATTLVQGCGGMSGSDRSAYRIFCGGE